MTFLNEIRCISGNKKGLLFIILFRTSYFFANSNLFLKILGFPIRVAYTLFVQWILGIDIPDKTKIGYCFNVWHGQGLVIHPNCLIGNNVTVNHNTTIGQKNKGEIPPIIGNNVKIGTHCVIIGSITIGNNTTIGAGTFVNKSIPDNSVVFGNPMIIKTKVNIFKIG